MIQCSFPFSIEIKSRKNCQLFALFSFFRLQESFWRIPSSLSPAQLRKSAGDLDPTEDNSEGEATFLVAVL